MNGGMSTFVANSSKRFSLLREHARNEVPHLISLKREGPYWDFKKQWHEENWKLIHDIICLANNLDSSISYLIIGIDEDNDYRTCDVTTNSETTRKTNQNLVDLLSKQHWGSPQAPFALIDSLEFGEGCIDIIVIQSRREDMPYYLEKPNGQLKAWMIHTRRIDSNTPVDVGANWSEIQEIWRHHFALDASPLEQAKIMLRDKNNWTFVTNIGNSEDKYYKFAPEYTIRHTSDDERNGLEYYLLNQTDYSPHWYTISLNYHQTCIFDTQGIALDGGRYFAPVPTWSFIRWYGIRNKLGADVSYCYFERDSINWVLNEFFFDESSDDARISRSRFLDMVVLFDSYDERLDFEWELKYCKTEFERRFSSIEEPYKAKRLLGAYPERGREMFQNQIRAIPVIKSMLDDYRNGKLSGRRLNTSRDW